MKKRVSLLLIVAIFLLAACGGREEALPTPIPATALSTLAPAPMPTPIPEISVDNDAQLLQSTPWQWLSYLDRAVGEFAIPDPQNYVVTFQADGTVQVKADCNNAAGTYTTNGSSMTITLDSVTLATCSESSRSEQFLTLLSGAAVYGVVDTQLRIDLFAEAGSLAFIPEWANPPASPTPVSPPPTAVPPEPTASPVGSCADSGPRQHANGTYTAPHYTVAIGDTIYSIGLRFGLSNQQLFKANPGADNGIVTGQTLVIPCGSQEHSLVVAPSYERVTFNPGTIAATFNSSIDNNQPRGFVIRAFAGQTMQINMASAAEYLTIDVQFDDGAGQPGTSLPLNGTNSTANNNAWVTLPYTGDYFVTIVPITAPESPNMSFTITFTVQ
ncbi:MAG: hypothetical protein CSB13_01000 [Chloroflexi bacterium]|nr:MAG: hypothetical protein CSB13_01000 [Chloroflexota bacterium]